MCEQKKNEKKAQAKKNEKGHKKIKMVTFEMLGCVDAIAGTACFGADVDQSYVRKHDIVCDQLFW